MHFKMCTNLKNVHKLENSKVQKKCVLIQKMFAKYKEFHKTEEFC